MNEKKLKVLNDEVNEIIESRFNSINEYYTSIRDAYQNPYSITELDPLRHETCLCIFFGLCQAAMTLTNHFLESLLKYALVVKDGKSVHQSAEQIKGRSITALSEKYARGYEKYGSLNLYNTINHAWKEKLITQEQKDELHVFREIFRNAYSHADKEKTFGKSTMPVSGMRLEGDKIVPDESSNPEIANFPIGQSIIQAQLSQEHCVSYFLYIDALARAIKVKLYGNKEDRG